MNNQRAKQGKAPVFLKKRQIKELRYKKKFQKIESRHKSKSK